MDVRSRAFPKVTTPRDGPQGCRSLMVPLVSPERPKRVLDFPPPPEFQRGVSLEGAPGSAGRLIRFLRFQEPSNVPGASSRPCRRACSPSGSDRMLSACGSLGADVRLPGAMGPPGS